MNKTDKEPTYNLIKGNLVDVKMWTKFVPVESGAIDQLRSITSLPFVFKHVAAMPDVHIGVGSTVGTVLATKSAVIPAAVGVDIGCGMIACRLSLKADDLPDNLHKIRNEIELMVPVGFDQHSISRLNQTGHQDTRQVLNNHWRQLSKKLDELTLKHLPIEKMAGKSSEKGYQQLGSLGGGNHFIEICLDENNDVWIMLHSGSRGMGNIIGRYFIDIAQKDMARQNINLPHRDLAYLQEGSQHYDDYVEAVEWAQDYAKRNRDVMLELVITALTRHLPKFTITKEAVNSHHNYISHETHFGEELIITRKGAVSAQFGQLGIIPGSMGAKSYIVRGLGNSESFCSCSHGAGRVMSRSAAKKNITIEQHIEATQGVECRKDIDMVDESPAAYKDIDSVMKSQEDLVEIVHTLKQVICVKG
jgi:tRNA-splicing ligase RtcB